MNDSVVQAFQVEAVEGHKTVMRATYNKEKGGFDYTPVKEEWGFMVYFPGGHSLRVKDVKELERLGFTDKPKLVDLETGEEVPQHFDNSPKAMVQRNTQTRGKVVAELEE